MNSRLLCLLGLCALACGTETASSPSPPHIVLIVMDTVRQDHLSCYGYERDTTPFLNELSASSTVFDNAYSTSSWTSPAHASLFTGLFPIEHHTTQENWVLAERFVTLAEQLAQVGYETVGIAENPMLSRSNGFDQGFASYKETWREEVAAQGDALHHFRQAVAVRDTSQPLFAFVNLLGAHSPYNSGGDFAAEFVRDRSIHVHANLWREFFLGTALFTEAELGHLRELYDSEIRRTDSVVREMARELQSAGLWEQTVFVVTSDHGENIGDHGLMDHVFSLYESTTKIPLLIHDPLRFEGGARVSLPVQLPDVFATLALRAGVEGQVEGGAEGNALWNLRDERPVFCEYYYPKQALLALGEEHADAEVLAPFRRRLRSVQTDSYKLIWGSDGRHELYDLAADPSELRNLAQEPKHAPQLTRLMSLLEEWSAAHSSAGDPAEDRNTPDPETLRALEKIGYAK